jgi:hypothetical protein
MRGPPDFCVPSNCWRQSTFLIRDFIWGPPTGALQDQCYICFELSFEM